MFSQQRFVIGGADCNNSDTKMVKEGLSHARDKGRILATDNVSRGAVVSDEALFYRFTYRDCLGLFEVGNNQKIANFTDHNKDEVIPFAAGHVLDVHTHFTQSGNINVDPFLEWPIDAFPQLNLTV